MERSTPITLTQLESHLWDAANILRGPVDAADFKTYVFPLLFFKRISDVHDVEYQTALAEADGDAEYALFPQNYRFQIPDGCHWEDVRAVSANVGQALQKAMRGIEQANPETLYGIFGDAQWTNKERLPDSLLRDLIEHFSRISLGNEAAQADILGQSYDVKENHGDDRTLWGKLFGQERNLTTAAIARMNLFLHGAADFQVVRGDTLRNPAFFSGDSLGTFDCVIANLSIPLYVAPQAAEAREDRAGYAADGLPGALSAWLASSAQVRVAIQGLLDPEKH